MLAFPKFLHWAARTVALVVAVFFLLLMFSELVAPHSRPPAGWVEWGQVTLLLLVIVGMLLAWKWELPGTLLSLGALVLWALAVRMSRYPDIVVLLAAPGILFLGDWMLHFGQRDDRNP